MKIEDVLHTKHVLRSPDIFPGQINRGVRLTVYPKGYLLSVFT